MSTRASIVLKLKDEDIGKKMKFEPSRLPLGITCDMAGDLKSGKHDKSVLV